MAHVTLLFGESSLLSVFDNMSLLFVYSLSILEHILLYEIFSFTNIRTWCHGWWNIHQVSCEMTLCSIPFGLNKISFQSRSFFMFLYWSGCGIFFTWCIHQMSQASRLETLHLYREYALWMDCTEEWTILLSENSAEFKDHIFLLLYFTEQTHSPNFSF